VVGVELRLAIDDDDSDVTAAGRFVVVAVGGVIDAWLGGRVGPGVPEGLERGEDPISAPELEATLRPVLVELRLGPLGTVEPAREGVEGDLRSWDGVEGERDFEDEVMVVDRLAVEGAVAVAVDEEADRFRLSGIGGRCFADAEDASEVFVKDEVADFVLPTDPAVVVPAAFPVEADNGFFVPAAAAAAGLGAILGFADAAPIVLAFVACFGNWAFLVGRGSVLSETPPSWSWSLVWLLLVALDSISTGGRRMMGSSERGAAMSFFLGSSETATRWGSAEEEEVVVVVAAVVLLLLLSAESCEMVSGAKEEEDGVSLWWMFLATSRKPESTVSWTALTALMLTMMLLSMLVPLMIVVNNGSRRNRRRLLLF
jgi:hypothetical protein